MKHKTLSFLLALLMSMVATVASAYEIDGIYYIFSGYEAEVFGSIVSPVYSGDIVIPESVSYEGMTYSVTSIREHAFFQCKDLTSITIPSSLKSIGSDAFYRCYGLLSVSISDLTAWCEISFAGDTSNPLSYAHHLYINGSEITDLVIPDNVTSIGNETFDGCSSLTSVTIPNSVTSIGRFAFGNCKGLTSITIPNSVTSIGGYAFEGCSGLTSVTIPNSVTSIGDYAFKGCYFTYSSFMNNSVLSESDNSYWRATMCDEETKDGLLINDKVAIKCRPWATSVTIPNSVTSIDYHAFFWCTNLTSVTIPESVTEIGDGAFGYCSNLKEVYCLAKVPPTLGMDAFPYSVSLVKSMASENDGNEDRLILYVPIDSRAAYEEAGWLDYFAEIVEVDVTGVLPMDNGQLIMDNANGVYDLSGRKINVNDNLKQLKKGVYIVNGRKVLKR